MCQRIGLNKDKAASEEMDSIRYQNSKRYQDIFKSGLSGNSQESSIRLCLITLPFGYIYQNEKIK